MMQFFIHFLLFNRLQNLKRARQVLVDTHQRSGIIEFIAIVRGGEQRHQFPTAEKLIAILDDLMRSTHQIEIVVHQEFRQRLLTERTAHTALTDTETVDICRRIRPQQITGIPVFGDFTRSLKVFDLLDVLQMRRNACDLSITISVKKYRYRSPP